MKILWIAPGLPANVTDPEQVSLASHRYRVLFPAHALRQLGHEVLLENLAQDQAPLATILTDFRPETILVGKLLPVGSLALPALVARLFPLLEAARAAGIPVLADINDDHFTHPVLGQYWQQLLNYCDGVISGSPAMSTVIARYRPGLPQVVVGDPAATGAAPAAVWPGDRAAEKQSGWGGRLLHRLLPAEATRPRLRMVWYGSPGNWPGMAALARELAAWSAEQPFLLDIVCAEDEKIEAFVDDYNQQHGPDACLDLLPWSVETTAEAIARAHLVLIPADLSDPSKTVKTANRLIDAVHAGRFVVAAAVPAYQEFATFAWLGQDLLTGIRWYLANPEAALEKIRAGQEYIANHYTTEKIALRWLAAMTTLQAKAAASAGMASTSPAPVTHTETRTVSTPIRLNLGCGDKILPGYINVDVAPSRRGLAPDVLCDLRDLSVFPDDYADEILSVHVVEHFWRWEVLDILKGWMRVLKPGGRMIVECPNLISACQTLLANPELASQPGPAGQRSMWVLYGDPSWKDPLMIHRWGYTPQSLQQLLAEAGLVQVQQTPAQYKLREPRDMRLEAVKPVAGAVHYEPATTAVTALGGELIAPLVPGQESQVWDQYFKWFHDGNVWKNMTYHGIRTLKLPSDMWNYQEIIFEKQIDWVIETGTRHGGSALFFADTLAARRAKGRVISIDIDSVSRQVQADGRIDFLIGDSAGPAMVENVRKMLPENRGPLFMILDSDHSRHHVFRELEAWADLLQPGDYLIVEDGCVNGHPVRPEHGPGPLEAVVAWRQLHPEKLRHDAIRERKFGATAAPQGYYEIRY